MPDKPNGLLFPQSLRRGARTSAALPPGGSLAGALSAPEKEEVRGLKRWDEGRGLQGLELI